MYLRATRSNMHPDDASIYKNNSIILNERTTMADNHLQNNDSVEIIAYFERPDWDDRNNYMPNGKK